MNKYKDYNELLPYLEKIGQTKTQKINKKWFSLDRFEISRHGIHLLFFYGSETIQIFHCYTKGKPNISNCKSYFEALRNAALDYDEKILPILNKK
jgi:hypothetical protein